MLKAYYAITWVGPFVPGQVVVLDEQDGWARSGYLHELVDPSLGPGPAQEVDRGGPRQDRP